MPFVVDASVAACWLLPDEGNARAQAAFARFPGDTAIAPSLWWFEMRNIFISNERSGRIDGARSSRALALLNGLPIRLDHQPDDTVLMALARAHQLTAYDAAYLELALRESVPLATLDDALLRAAHAEGVGLVGESA
ncbi:type II toxin-antitoxin system VapC family toxin [Novosphingobium sp. Fuku2-ISO-50]|uniref:type II toxin-antitoxin system VapC family toxin n=1 Tax=Novosphingobium sp. Fuku2-ISO-50 TaxID=1739114 RepID=UPI00076CDFE6|nr:type II toxin-antitoxin system VapC family toxin [Novosphingobium sp. Fuku2-ISO-50]KUR75293.1 twitching motility protein PilT [Novosphingobium sp. Fuku2-ISO-50]